MEPLDIHTAVDGPTALVRIDGELDASTAPVLDEALRKVITDGVERLVIDFSELEFVDSAGLSVLVATHKRLQSGNGGELVISSPSAAVRRLFGIAGLDRVLTITE